MQKLYICIRELSNTLERGFKVRALKIRRRSAGNFHAVAREAKNNAEHEKGEMEFDERREEICENSLTRQ